MECEKCNREAIYVTGLCGRCNEKTKNNTPPVSLDSSSIGYDKYLLDLANNSDSDFCTYNGQHD